MSLWLKPLVRLSYLLHLKMFPLLELMPKLDRKFLLINIHFVRVTSALKTEDKPQQDQLLFSAVKIFTNLNCFALHTRGMLKDIFLALACI